MNDIKLTVIEAYKLSNFFHILEADAGKDLPKGIDDIWLSITRQLQELEGEE